MKAFPVPLELGPKDIANNQCVLVRRDNRQKYFVSLDNLETEIPKVLEELNTALYNNALERRAAMTYTVETLDEMIETAKTKPGFIRAMKFPPAACPSGKNPAATSASAAANRQRSSFTGASPIDFSPCTVSGAAVMLLPRFPLSLNK